MLSEFTCVRAIGKFWNICLGVNILSRVAKSGRSRLPCADFIENILLLKVLTTNSRPFKEHLLY